MERLVWLMGFMLVPFSLLADGAEAELPVYELKDYVVRAWHFEKDTLEVPADVVRIDRQAIDRSLAVSVTDLLEVEANLFFSNLSGNESVSLRGFGENSGLRSLILVDGQPLNPSDMGRINWEQLPLDSIETIEVLRGGHNVLYGDKALAGVIKIETRRTGKERLDGEGRVGIYGLRQGSLSGATGRNSWSLSAGTFFEDNEGYRENSRSETRSGYVHAGRTFGNADDLDLRLSFGEVDLRYPDGLSYEDYLSDPRKSNNDGEKGSRNRYLTLTGRLEGERTWGKFELLGGYDRNDTRWSFGPTENGDNEQNGYSLKPRFRFGEEDLSLIVGADLLYDSLDFVDDNETEPALSPGVADIGESRLSPYFLVEKSLGSQLTVSGGIRHEWVRYEVDYESVEFDPTQLDPFIEVFGELFENPNFKDPPDVIRDNSFSQVIREDGSAAELSFNYRMTESLSFWAGYDRVYRYPVFDERAAYQGFELAEAVSEDLEAEEGDGFEMGMKWASAHHELYITGFFLMMDNEIVFDPDVEDEVSLNSGLNINLGAVHRYGLDLAYYYDRGDWGFSVQLAAVETEIRSGDWRGSEVPLVPDLTTTSQLWWEPFESLRLRAVHRFVGERFQGGDFTNEQRKVSEYHLFDFHSEWTAFANARLFFSINNVFDELYPETVYYDRYYPGTGRSFTFGVKLNF